MGGRTLTCRTPFLMRYASVFSFAAAALALLPSLPASTWEIETAADFTTRSDLERADVRFGSAASAHTLLQIVATPMTPFGVLRLGGAWERFSFSNRGGNPLPNTLQSYGAIVGLDTRLGESILLRLEVKPGFYVAGGRAGSHSFNAPALVGGSYLYSENLQFILGVQINPDSKYPVIGGPGLRWKFAPGWTLNAVLPSPRLEYAPSKALTLYAGANLLGGTFRTDSRYGSARGDARLNRAVLSYSEVRTGGGFIWELRPGTKLEVEAGAVVKREYDFHRADARWTARDVAAYGGLSLSASF